MALKITANNFKYRDKILQMSECYIHLQPNMGKTVPIIVGEVPEGEEELQPTHYQVQTKVVTSSSKESNYVMDITGIPVDIPLRYSVETQDLNQQYRELHEDLIRVIEERNPDWAGKIQIVDIL